MKKLCLLIIFSLVLNLSFAQKKRTTLTPNFVGKSKKELFDILQKLNIEISDFPNSHKAYYNRSFLKYTMLDTLGAVEDMEKALAIDPENIEYHYMHAYEIVDMGRYDEVIKECQHILNTHQKNADVYVLMGHALDMSGKYEGAREKYRSALAIDSLYDDAYMRYAISYMFEKKYDEALVWAKKLLEKHPGSADGFKLLTSLNILTKNYKAAIENADKMIGVNKSSSEPYEMKADIYDSLGNKKEACKCMLQAFRIHPYYDIHEYIMKNCPDEQKDTQVKVVQLQIEGNKYKEMMDFENAYKCFSQTVDLSPDSAASYYNRGKAKRNLEDHKGAIEDYLIAIKKDPNFSLAYVGLGVSYTFLGQFSDAKKTYLKCMEIDPLAEMAYYNFGDILRNQEGNIKEAVFYYKYAANLKPDYVKAWYWLGDCYGQLNMNSEACEAFRAAEKLGDPKAISQRIWYCR